MELRVVLVASLALQYTAAVLAFRLIRVTGRRTAWGLITVAITLMAVRRTITCYRLFDGNTGLLPDLSAELVALVISLLMVIGVGMIAPFFARAQHSEEALHESEEKYRSLTDDVLDTANVGIFILDSSFTVVWVNQAVELYFGISRSDLIGQDMRRTMRERMPAIVEHPDEIVNRIIASYNDNTYTEGFECHILANATRKERWLEHSSQPIHTGPYAGGRIEHYYDITERREAQATLQARADQQAAIADLGRQSLTSEHLVTLMNDMVKRIATTLGVEYCKVLELLPGGDDMLLRAGVGWKEGAVGNATVRSGVNSQAGYTLRSEQPVVVEDLRTETRFSGPTLLTDHEVVSGMSVVIHGQHQPWGVLGAHTTAHRRFTRDDVNFLQAGANLLAEAILNRETQEQRNQLAKKLWKSQKMEAMGTFAAGAAHDFNNTLTAILGFADLARRWSADENKVTEFMEDIVHASEQAAGITKAMLTFSRKSEGEKVTVDMGDVVRESVKMVLSMLPANIDLSTDIAPSENLLVFGDQSQLRRVVVNLAINARDAMPDGGQLLISLDRSTSTTEDSALTSAPTNENSLVLVVQDDGVGMSEDVRERAFEPFFTTKAGGKGTGLGLAVVHGIIVDHGGNIAVTSTPGRGTRVTITLPSYSAQALDSGNAAGATQESHNAQP